MKYLCTYKFIRHLFKTPYIRKPLALILNYLLICLNRHAKCSRIKEEKKKYKTNTHIQQSQQHTIITLQSVNVEKKVKNEMNRERTECSQNHNQIKALSAVEQQSGHWCGIVKRITLYHIYFQLDFSCPQLWCLDGPSFASNNNEWAFLHLNAFSTQMSITTENEWIDFSLNAYVTFTFQRPNAKRANFVGQTYSKHYIILLLIAVDVVVAWLIFSSLHFNSLFTLFFFLCGGFQHVRRFTAFTTSTM